DLLWGAVRGEVVVAIDGLSVRVAFGARIPSSVHILMPGQPVEGALHRQLAGPAGTGEPRAGGSVGLYAGPVDPGDLRGCPHGWTLAERGQAGAATRRRRAS